ncbi:hypothetical protein EAF04_004242 [Stromatinia cepivora]|nr:hypothetical protein EAF04_004242 [Stromatinia cepivora]
MAWPNPFRRNDKNTRNAWGYTFQWTPEHLTEEQMHPMKFSYDEGKEKPKRDLYALLRDHSSEDEKLGELWEEINTIPDWVDWDQIGRGQEVFYRYGGAALTGLAYQSLLGGMGAARVTEVLARTGGFSTKENAVHKNTFKERSFKSQSSQTTHIFYSRRSSDQSTVTEAIEAIKPGGTGHISSIKARLLHAAVRRRILSLAKEKPSYYSTEEYGIPINDLDSIATIGTFSTTLIWLSFPRQGIFLRPQEIADYIALWRLVAHYLGTPTTYFSSPTPAKKNHGIHPPNRNIPLPNLHNPRKQHNPLPQKPTPRLPLPLPPRSQRPLAKRHQTIQRPRTRSIGYLDRKQIKFLRRVLPMVIHSPTMGLATETDFALQYVPELETKTELGEYVVGWKQKSGVERRNLKALTLAVVGVGIGVWVVWKGVVAVGRSVV